MTASSATWLPGFTIFCPFTRTCPASSIACARSREGARPRSTSNTSRRAFPALGVLFFVSEEGLSRVGLDFMRRGTTAVVFRNAVQPEIHPVAATAQRVHRNNPALSSLSPPNRPQLHVIAPVRTALDTWPCAARDLSRQFFRAQQWTPPHRGCRPPPEKPSRCVRRIAAAVRRPRSPRPRQFRLLRSKLGLARQFSSGGYTPTPMR